MTNIDIFLVDCRQSVIDYDKVHRHGGLGQIAGNRCSKGIGMKDHQKRGSMVVSQRIGQRRHYVLLLITAAFITFATAWWLQFEGTGSQQLSHGDSFRGLAWAAWGFLVLAATFHRGWGRPTSEQRGALSDELTLAHRRSAIGAGYWITLLGAGLLLGITLIGGADLSVPLLILLLTIGVAAPALLFFVLQLQAARD